MYKKIVTESKLNLLSDELQIYLWNEFCMQDFNDEAKIYKNGDYYFKDVLGIKNMYGIIEIVKRSNNFSEKEQYVTTENAEYNQPLSEKLLKTSNDPRKLMMINESRYDDFLCYCDEWNFR